MTTTYTRVTPFAARLRDLREQYALTQAALASLSGLAEGHLQHLEAGRGEPTMHTLRRLARAFEMSISQLLENVE